MDHSPPRNSGAWNDPGFSPRAIEGRQPSRSTSEWSAENSPFRRNKLRARWRTSSLLIALLVIWVGILLDPMVGGMLWEVALGFGITLAVLGLAMGLGWAGSGLFAIGDRILAWMRAGTRWPDDEF